jgi:hypothetical protein
LPSTSLSSLLAVAGATTLLLACVGIEEPTAGEPSSPGGKADDHATSRIGAIDTTNDPASLDPTYDRRYGALPLEGSAHRVPWTDTYWPKYQGGISNRWQTGEHFGYASPPLSQLMAMSRDDIGKLSPTEKYDILVGNYNYSLTSAVQGQNRPTEASWQGYCHGWTPAAIHFDEPKPVAMTNDDGIVIPFGSADVKALLTYFQGEVVTSRWSEQIHPFQRPARVLGSLCAGKAALDPGCYDANPGSFHIVMANQLGLRGEAFGIDAVNGYEKWNQPVHRFTATELSRRPPSEGASESAVEEVVIRASVTYTQEIHATWDAVGGTDAHSDTTKTYAYTLELDPDGEIVGGQWLYLLDDGGDVTYAQVVTYLSQQDRDGDGAPDLSRGEVAAQVLSLIDFPDYVWTADRAGFSDTFEQAVSSWSFVATTQTSKRALYRYMAYLRPLYESSIGQTPTYPETEVPSNRE